jgi:hypothetical protein
MNSSNPIDHEALAAYYPRGFMILLKNEVFVPPLGPGIPEFSQESFPIFMHELAHLVQDRSTIRGVVEFLDMWDRVEAIAEHISACGHHVVVPFFDSDTGATRLSDNLKWTIEAETIYSLREPREPWSSDGKHWAYQGHEVESVECRLAGRTIKIPRVTVVFIDNVSGDTYQHLIGAREIKEAYSVAVALVHGGSLPDIGSIAFEYVALERILSFFFGDVRPRQIIAICQWALQSLAPGFTLFEIIDAFTDGIGLPDEEEIYNVLRRKEKFRGCAGIWNVLSDNIKLYEQHLGPQCATLGKLFHWYREHAGFLLTIQFTESRCFPLDTYLTCDSTQESLEDHSKGLRQLFDEVEVPLIVWPNGSFTLISSDPETVREIVFLNVAIQHLIGSLWSSRKASWSCPLHTGCTLSMKDDSECLHSPWKKGALLPTCPYGAAAILLRLHADVELVAGNVE